MSLISIPFTVSEQVLISSCLIFVTASLNFVSIFAVVSAVPVLICSDFRRRELVLSEEFRCGGDGEGDRILRRVGREPYGH